MRAAATRGNIVIMQQLNLWRHTGGQPIDAAPLERDGVADVVIVGGGFTGCSAALHLAEAGADVHLIEAETIGYGGSGRNVGLVNAGLWTPPDEVEQMLGHEVGQRLNEVLASAPKLVFDLIARHDIQCEATPNGTLHCAHSRAGMADLHSRYRQQIARGAPVELLDDSETQRRTGSHAFHGALFDPRAGTIQPLVYVRGLARAALAAGAKIYEHSAVMGFTHDGAAWTVNSHRGTLHARTLIQATDSYERRSDAPATYTPVHYFQCATSPLSAESRRKILHGREGCWDTAAVMTSFRCDDAGRMIIGAVGNLEGAGASTHKDWAARKLVSLFPELAGQTFEHAWSGRIGMTSDHLPKVTELGPRGIAIYGYSGRGIGPGSTFGRAAAAWASSEVDTAFPVPITPQRTESFTTIKKYYYELGSTLTHLIGARLLPRRSKD
jgi:glycine/D-amino acid oxidase-like deaminating enzyme